MANFRRARRRESSSQQCFTAVESGSAWTPVEQREGGGGNICIRGRLVPQLYLLGSPLSANSFAVQMSGAGVQCAGSRKAYDFWNEDMLANFREDHNATTDRWIHELPWCGEGKVRRIAADFSTSYMGWVPKPQATLEKAAVARLPWVLASLYGVHGKELHFVVMLRDPLVALYAEWNRGLKVQGFKAWAWNEIQSMTDPVWSSMYGWQMSLWTYIFRDSQFYIIPGRLFHGMPSETICRELSARLNFDMMCRPVAPQDVAIPPAIDMIRETMAEDDLYNSTMLSDKSLLIDILQRGSSHGMGLSTYAGENGMRVPIKIWLEAHW